jgi:PHD/YefM family antitoxin component YafN of YafNO toxin-antitoxin module
VEPCAPDAGFAEAHNGSGGLVKRHSQNSVSFGNASINKEKHMLVETKQMVPITRLQKELTQTVRELSDSGKAVYILKNNNMEAVLLSYAEYEYLKNIEEIFEQFEIKNIV